MSLKKLLKHLSQQFMCLVNREKVLQFPPNMTSLVNDKHIISF